MIKLVKFDNTDIERSEIVKKVLNIYNYVKPYNETNIFQIVSPLKRVDVNNSSNINSNTTIVSEPKKVKLINKNNDAALMPKHHISHNFDIFFESRDF